MKKPIIISIANQKGGVGKTTTAIELAASLNDLGKKILLIDFDQQCNLTSYVNAQIASETPTIYDALHASVAIVETIQHLGFADVIPASPALSRADREFVEMDDFYLLKDLLELDEINKLYDYVLIDNSPSRNVLLTMAYIAADYVIIPTECDDGALDGILAINEDIVKLRDGRTHYTDATVLGLILVKFEKTVMHTIAFQNDLKEISDTIGSNPFLMTVRKSISVSETKKNKTPLQEYDKTSKPAEDYRKIAIEIVNRLEN